MEGTVAIVVKGYPRLSETFIAQEIRGLELAGLRLEIVSLRRPTDGRTHPVHAEIEAPVTYLPEYLHEQPLRVLAAWWRARRLPGYGEAWRRFVADLRRDPTRNRVRRFGQACVLAAELGPRIAAIHAHFIHTPGSVARYAAAMLGLGWTCSAHAKDIWTSAEAELAAKLADVDWVVTCTRAGHAALARLATRPDAVHLSYHGLDLDRFAPAPTPRPPRDGGAPDDPVRIVSVGRAVEKKGYDVLLAALAELPQDLAWRFDHVGGGGLTDALAAEARRLGLADRITWHGARAQDEVLALYRAGDLFVLPCRIAADGDRDGLPNVIVEAASQGLACLSTTVSGVPELIEDGVHGVLVAPGDPSALAAAIARLARDPALRARLGAAAEARVRGQFDHRASIGQLMALFARPAPAGE